MTQNFWASKSVVEYTFGAVAFGKNPVCQVVDSAGKTSNSVSKCVVSGAKVTLTWAKNVVGVDYSVRVLNM